MQLSKNPDKSLYMESIRSNVNVTCQNEFISRTDKRAMSGQAQRLVKNSNLINANYIKDKRERLRKLLSMEEMFYQQELYCDFKTKIEERIVNRENRLLSLRSERERQRLKFTDQMRVQRIINSCDEIRPYLRRKLQDECKNCQLLQIEDNNMKKTEQLDLDRLWDEVQKEVFNKMIERERDEFLLARSRNSNNQNILRKQMAEKSEIIEQVRHEATICGNAIQDISTTKHDHPIQIKLRQRQFAQELLSQQEEKAKTKRDIKSREIKHDLAIIKDAKDEIRLAEENLIKQKIQNMKQTLHFLDYSKNVRKERSLADKEREEIIESLQNQKKCEYLKNRSKFSLDRDEFNKRIYQERWNQIKYRRQKLLQEKHQKINEIIEANQIYAENARMENELAAKRRNFRQKYGQELKAQWNYEKQRQDEANIATNKLMQVFEKEETKKSELIRTKLGKIYENYPVHPNFKAILNSKN